MYDKAWIYRIGVERQRLLWQIIAGSVVVVLVKEKL